MIRQMILVATILAFVLLGSTGCQRAEAHPAEKLPAEELPAEEQEQDLTEEVDDLKALASETTPPQDPAVVTATGEMVAWIHSELVPRQAGRIGRILVDEGSVVRKGEALLKLETDYLELAVTAAQAEVARARAGLLEAERDLARKQGLLEKESISRAVYDRVEAGFEGARAAHELTQAHLALAEKRLDDAVLRSPIDGVVAERRVDVGESAGPTKVAFVIVRTRPLKLRFHLPERYLPAVHKGLVVRAYVAPYPGEVFEGRIHLVGQVIDPANRSLSIEAELPNTDGRLRPGLFARVELELED